MLMVLGHSLSFPSWHISIPEFFHSCKHIVLLGYMTGICVPLFAFLTGWTYYHHKDKSPGYSIKKITTFLLNYWIILIPISLFAFKFCGYTYSIKFIFELLPARLPSLMIFTWYVWFYILMMALFPILGFAEQKNNRIYGGILVFLAVIGFCSHYIPYLSVICKTSPFALLGYFSAKFHILETCLNVARSRVAFRLFLGAFFLCCSLFLHFIVSFYVVRYYINPTPAVLCIKLCLIAVTAPLFIIGAILLYLHIQNDYIWVPFCFIGKHSMNIWFIHCVFFSKETRAVIQPIVFFRDNPIWIFSATLLFSLVISIIISPIQQQISKLILAPIFKKIGI